MKTKLYFTLLILLASISFAQVPKIDPSVCEEMARQKEKLYRQFILNEQQITANQENYDIKYYSLDLTPDPTTKILSGAVQVVGEVIAPTLDHIELNFWDGMSITDVHVSNFRDVQLNYHCGNDILSVDLDRTYVEGEKFSIVIAYNGRPQNSNYSYFDFPSFYFDTYNGNPMIGTLSEPFGARAWWPCKDSPSDKADSVDIRVTVPSNLIVASNGLLKETIRQSDKTTYWWHEKYPIATYLVSLAIHPYEVHYDNYLYNNGTDTMKIHFYTFSGKYNQYSTINAKVKDMIACFSQLFGQYPFVEEKYGHADFLHLSGGMEHQTCTSLGLGAWNEPTYVHELAHQWWGDMITCDSFHHIWLNEGFGTYSMALWYEYAYPPMTASEFQMANSLYFGSGTIFVENPENEEIFDLSLSYRKASWVLHMLRHVVGDSIFFDILKTYYASPEHQYGTATTEEFQAICEKVSGMDLEKFFHQWIYEEYFPRYSFSWNWVQNGSEYNIELEIQQTQTNYIFWMPLDVTISTISGETTFVIWDSLQTQSFQLSVSSKPIKLEIDKNNWILKQIQEYIINPANVSISSSFVQSGIDSLLILSQFINPKNHSFESHAIITSTDKTYIDSLALFDDGKHGDFQAGDDNWGNFYKLPSSIEKEFWTGISTVDLTTGGYFAVDSLARFTSIGPIVFQDYELQSPDTIPNPGETFRFKLLLRNKGMVANATNITAKISSLDTFATVSFALRRYLNIAPGATVTSNSYHTVTTAQDCPGNIDIPFRVDIMSGGYVFWTDTFSIHIYPTGVISRTEREIPDKFSLAQNYPNPFNPSTTIEFALPKSAFVTLKVYNLLGKEVATLVAEQRSAGIHKLNWDARGLASGVYLYRLEAGDFVQAKKLILMR